MTFLIKLVLVPIKLGIFFGLLAWSAFAIIAFLGFLHPLADAFNHLQLIWFFGLIGLLIGTVLFFRSGWIKRTLLLIGGLAFASSAYPVLSEALRAAVHVSPQDSGYFETRVMSRNLFGLNYNMTNVAAQIAEQDPDILAFQEYYSEQSRQLHPLISAQYPFFEDCTGGHRAAIAIYSKTPFVLGNTTLCPQNLDERSNEIARLDAEFELTNGQTWRLINTHLNWPVQASPLRMADLSWPEKLAAMTARKDTELSDLVTALNSITVPKIAVGDFNSTPWSYQLKQFAADASLTRATKNIPTFPARFFIKGWRQTLPFLPLDHVFAGGSALIFEAQAMPPAGSDHLAIVADVAIPNVTQTN